MSVRIFLPVKKVTAIRKSKTGKIEIYGLNVHYNPDKGIAAGVQKFKDRSKTKSQLPEISKYYRELGEQGISQFSDDLHYEVYDKYDKLFNLEQSLIKISNAIKRSKKLSRQIDNLYISKHIDAILSGNVSKGKKNSIKQLLRNLQQIHEIARDRKIGGISDNTKHKIPFELRELYDSDYKFMRKYFDNVEQIDEVLSSYTKFTNFIKEIGLQAQGKYSIDEILGNKEFNDMLEELFITSPIEFDDVAHMVDSMVNNSHLRMHIFNNYLKELSLNSDNERTRELAKMLASLEEDDSKGMPKVSPHIFYDIYNAVTSGTVRYDMTPKEATLLFFYINSNSTEGKKLPFNYLDHNNTIRALESKLLENNLNLDELSNNEKFFIHANEILDKAISKLPKKENVTVYRGENVNPITFYARKGDAIVYLTPVSTTPIWEKKTTMTFSYISPVDNEIKVISRETRQGAKVFARGNGSYQRQNGAIITGKRPEQYEGHREFLQDVQKELIGGSKYSKQYPAGSYLEIKADEAYVVPHSFTTYRNVNVYEHLLRPGTVIYVESWIGNPDENRAGYKVEASTVKRSEYTDNDSSFVKTAGTLLNLENWNVDEQGRLIPKKRKNG